MDPFNIRLYFCYPIIYSLIVVDVFLPQRIDGILQILSTVIISLVSAAVVIPWILIGVVPVLIAFAVLKNIFNASTRQMKRLSNVANSPLFAHLNTTTQGLSTIEAYQERNSFTEKQVYSHVTVLNL